MNIINNYFSHYSGKFEKFKLFNSKTLNMPREGFDYDILPKLQSLAYYLKSLYSLGYDKPLFPKKISQLIIEELKNENFSGEFRNNYLESKFFTINPSFEGFEDFYETNGRMLRHLFELCTLFGLLKNSAQYTNKRDINIAQCEEFLIYDKELLMAVLRNILLEININSNDHIKNLTAVSIKEDADYQPAYSILKFLSKIKRPASMFEICNLFGRIDELQTNDEIIRRALKIANSFPDSSQVTQINKFFNALNWTDSNGNKFRYKSSSEPHFKFKNFVIFMSSLKLINYENNDNITITKYGKKLLESDIKTDIIDLEELYDLIEDKYETESNLRNIFICKIDNKLFAELNYDSKLIKKINERSLKYPRFNRKNKKPKRNILVKEIAKIKANYICELTGKKTFETPNGNNYVEAHHIIEFSKGGPDITDNLVILGPEKHKLVHYASDREKEKFFNELVQKNIVNFDRFEKMHKSYKCLKKEHPKLLYEKNIINLLDKEKLEQIIVNS